MDIARRQMLGGLSLFGAAALAMILANSPVGAGYQDFASLDALKGAAIFLFFLSVGIELRQEVFGGSLSKPKQAIVPILAAVGGMVLPVTIYTLFNAGTPAAAGWGVPMSSDMAFALGVLAIAGRWLPRQIRTYVLTVAVVDDTLTILVIAIFFASSFHLLSLASLAGVILGLLLPGAKRIQPQLETVVAFIALPLFALMSAGISFDKLNAVSEIPIFLVVGIFAAMMFGKPLGIIGTTWLVVKTGFGKLPAGIVWKDLAAALLAFGMCFTLAMVMTELSFGDNPGAHALANVSVIGASIVMAIVSMAALTFRKMQQIDK
jgi:NhaA family Na+:H+ antiporter